MFNSMKITNQSGAEIVDSVEAQAKTLENLGCEVSKDDKLTRLIKECLIDRRYSNLAHSLYTANDMTCTRASSLIKGY